MTAYYVDYRKLSAIDLKYVYRGISIVEYQFIAIRRLIDKVIPRPLRESAFVYLDDPLVCLPTFEKYLAMLFSQVSYTNCLNNNN